MTTTQEELHHFITWCTQDLTHFVALVEEGSTVTNEPFQPGFSDFDITIVVQADVEHEMAAVYQFLERYPVPDTFLFGPRLTNDFLQGDTLNDLSLKFRSRTIAGEDVVRAKEAPDRERAYQVGINGLKDLEVRCERRWLNTAHWSVEQCRSKNYDIFKNFFVLCAARLYGETGHYPTRRSDIAAQLPHQDDALQVLTVTNAIANSSKQDQKEAFAYMLEYIRRLDTKPLRKFDK